MLQQVLAELQEGDTLVIHELDRLGRSMIQMLQCAEQLVERGIGLITLVGKLNTDTMDPSIVKLIVGVLGYAAEMERKAIIKRTGEGRDVGLIDPPVIGPMVDGDVMPHALGGNAGASQLVMACPKFVIHCCCGLQFFLVLEGLIQFP